MLILHFIFESIPFPFFMCTLYIVQVLSKNFSLKIIDVNLGWLLYISFHILNSLYLISFRQMINAILQIKLCKSVLLNLVVNKNNWYYFRFGMQRFWNALSVNRDIYDLEYISTIEVKYYIIRDIYFYQFVGIQ